VLAIASFTQPANGTVAKDDQGTASTADDALVYTPTSGFTGSDSFSYVASDASPAGQSAATVTVTVRTAPTANTVTGTASSETLNGTGGNDLLNGLAGNDTIRGGAGNDTCTAGPGLDFFYGEGGNDVCRFSPGEGQDKWWDYQDGSDKIGLPAGIDYGDLTFRADTTWNYLWVRSGGADVLGLKNISQSQIDASDFVLV
jgi:Ca2+-binding RTX toxin-like protein